MFIKLNVMIEATKVKSVLINADCIINVEPTTPAHSLKQYGAQSIITLSDDSVYMVTQSIEEIAARLNAV